MTSWKVNVRYVVGPLNNHLSFEKGSPIGTKDVQSEPTSAMTKSHARKARPKVNIHKSSEQLTDKKRQRNLRYQRYLNERKQFWKSQNPNYVHNKRSSNQNAKARSHANSNHCSHCHSHTP